MKIKAGDVPLRVYNEICNRYRNCREECPFARWGGHYYKCKGVNLEYQDDLVDIPDDLMESPEEKWPIHNKNEALQMIIDLAVDYDNANSIQGLKNLIDELVEVAKAGMTK